MKFVKFQKQNTKQSFVPNETAKVNVKGRAFLISVHNQQRILLCGGLEALVNCLHRAVNRLHEGEKSVQLAACLTSTFDAVVTDNGEATLGVFC